MKTYLIGAVIALVVSVATVWAIAPHQAAVQAPKYGALAGPDIPSPYLRWGGVAEYNASEAPISASTTVCAIQSPAATSTLLSGGITLTVSSTTATIVSIAKATTAFATTTLIASSSVSANAQATISAASTTRYGISGQAFTAQELADRVFAPSSWLVFGLQGGTGTFSPSGSCQARWEVYST